MPRTRSSSCSSRRTESACSSCFKSGWVWSLVSTGISSESAINSRLRSISRPMMYSSLRSTTAAASLRLLFLQLPLPVEHACLGALRLGLGHHAGGLVEARQAGVREDVVGRELAELLPRLDRLRVPPELACRGAGGGAPPPRRGGGGCARRAERGVPPRGARLRAARGRVPHQRHERRGRARPPSRPVPRPLPCLGARDLRALRPARRCPPPVPLPRAAAGAAPGVLARADVRLGGRGARARHRVDDRRARPPDGRAR